MLLEKYHSKRDFTKTKEPKGMLAQPPVGNPLFVVQKHAASRLHFDVRLEIDGVLKSWAVPKGPSFDPQDKRLAVQTEDHPLAYADFEGVIPSGEYGAGAMIIWDKGVFQNGSERSLSQCLEEGLLEIHLEGNRLKGGFALKRFRIEKDKAQWLLIKMRDDKADPLYDPVSTEVCSIQSNKTLDEIKALYG